MDPNSNVQGVAANTSTPESTSSSVATATPEVTPVEKPKKKLSTGAKIAIGCGGVLLLGVILVVLLFFLGLWGAREAIQNANEVAEQYYEDEGYYTDTTYGFRIQAPEGWTTETEDTYGTLVMFFNPEIDEVDGVYFDANMNVVAEYTDGSCDNLDECKDMSIEALESYFTNYELVNTESVEVGDYDGYIVTSNYDHGEYSLRSKILYVQEDGVLYSVTATCLEGSENVYDTLFDTSLRTFELN